jgi:hypothetical protein
MFILNWFIVNINDSNLASSALEVKELPTISDFPLTPSKVTSPPNPPIKTRPFFGKVFVNLLLILHKPSFIK